MPKKYSNEFKKEVIRHYEQGESIKSISQELGLAKSTIYRWVKEFCSIETSVRKYTPAEFDKLFRHAEKLEHELEIIQCTGLVAEIPLQKKLALLEGIYHEGKYSVYELCEALGVARGTFYNHIFRRADRSGREKEQTELMLKVRQVFDDSSQRYGAEKIRIILADSGIRVGKRRIAEIMKELDLQSVRPEAKQQFKKRQQEQKKNWLERSFTAQHPNQTWVSDITYFRVGGYWLYLCIILDLYSRRIIGFKVSKNASTNLATSTFRAAYEERGRPKDLTFHSDRGTQYTCHPARSAGGGVAPMKITVTYSPEEAKRASPVLKFLRHYLPEAKIRMSDTHPPQCTIYMTTRRPKPVAAVEKTLDKTAPL